MLVLFLIILLVWLYVYPVKKNIVKIVDDCDHEKETELCKTMYANGSDKSEQHKYTRLYYDLFNDIKNDKLNIFEVGIGTKNPDIKSSMHLDNHSIPGGSHRGWRDFFKNSMIYGADIDKDILFSEDRIKTYYTNQLEPTVIKDMWTQIGDDVMFDIIIDDGLHTDEANYTFLMNSHHKLKSGGIYIIEDVQRVNEAHLKEYEKIFKYVKVAIMPNDPECLIVLQK